MPQGGTQVQTFIRRKGAQHHANARKLTTPSDEIAANFLFIALQSRRLTPPTSPSNRCSFFQNEQPAAAQKSFGFFATPRLFSSLRREK